MSLHYMFVKGDGMLNKGQIEAVEKAVIAGNKLLLIQGPPGMWNATIFAISCMNNCDRICEKIPFTHI